MELANMMSIVNYTAGKTTGALRGIPDIKAGRTAVSRNSRFKNILSAIETRNSKISYKTRGLTIPDYRARPVIAKSHLRPQPRPEPSATKKTLSHHIPGLSFKPAKSTPTQQLSHKTESMDTRNTIVKPLNKTRPQPADLEDQQVIEQHVQKAAEKYDLPPALIKAVIRAESNFQVDAVSAAGAQGLMQLMPATAEELGVNDPFDIKQNIEGGTRYLRKMLDRFEGSVRKALAAYNAGPGTVIKYNGRVPYPETRQYVKRVLRLSKLMT